MMYLKSLTGAASACLLALATSANADIVISAGSGSGGPGDPVAIPVVFDCQAGETPNAAQFDIEYDSSLFSNVDVSACLDDADSNFNSCVVAGNGDPIGTGIDAVRVSLLNNPAQVICPDANPSPGSVGTVTFTIAGSAAPQTIPLVVTDEVIDGGFPTQLVDGSIDVQAPAGSGFYASTPDPGGNVDLGAAVVNSAATAVDTLNVENPSPDTDFDITGFNGPATLVFPGTPITVVAGGNEDVPITCTPDARGDNGGNFSVEHDAASGAPSPVDYTFDCAGLAPNVQVPAGPVAINGLTVDPNPLQATFDVTNPEDGFTSDAMNVTAAAAGDAEISVEPLGPLTIATDDSQTFTVSCDNANAGSFSSTITIEWDDPVSGGTASDTIDATCDVSSAVASFDSDPGAPGPLAFGTVTNGTTSDPLGIDVINDGVGPSPDSDLTITGVSTDDAQFDAAIINAGPFVVGDPADGTDDIEVTCTPDAGAGAISGTLTVEHNGDDSPTLFDLTCSGESDGAFSSTPEPGGVLNLGVVPPTITTPEGFIDFTNNGSVDDITVSCTVTDDAGVFAFQPDPIDFTIAPGATESAGFECTPPDPISFQASVSCTIGGDPDIQSADYTVVCQGEPLVVPTMNRWGLVLMSLMLLLVAGFAGRRMMA